jgi:undecaprenyl-diphosphatase
MTIIEGVTLGAVQGITEFLPVSSSGHLILVRELFGLSVDHGLAVDAVLQLATILAVGIYFFRDLWAMTVTAARMMARRTVDPLHRTLVWAVVIGTIPAVAAGIALEDAMATVFRDGWLVAATLVAGAVLMAGAERYGTQRERLTVKKGAVVGLFQALALVPGVSRSGATISGGLFLGLARADAARFSFLLAFPVILGSGLKKLMELGAEGALAATGWGLAVGFVVSFTVGLACIHFLLKFLREHSLMPFVWYRIALAGITCILLLK